MMTKPNGSILVAMAFDLAEEAHRGHVRKGNGRAYFTHPIRVAKAVAALEGSTDEHLAAALLHDVLEDTPEKFAQRINEEFPREVWDLVCELTSPPYKIGDKYAAKRATHKKWERGRLSRCSSWAQTIKLCDRLDNVIELEGLDEGFRRVYAAETVLLVDALEDSVLNNPIKHRIMAAIADYIDGELESQ